jgi:hypothetical protein
VKQYVAWTRYVTPNGRVVMHVWGPPQPTRSKAQTVLRRVERSSDELQGNYGNMTTAVLKKSGRLTCGTTELIGDMK